MKRKMIVWMLVIGAVFLGAIGTVNFIVNEKVTPEVRAEAQATADRDYNEAIRHYEEYQKRCEASPTSEECVHQRYGGEPPQREWFQAEYHMPSTFEFRKDFGDMIAAWSWIIGILAFFIGASFIGAEWRTGAMMSLLTWRPKRGEVLSTKFGVLLGWLTVTSLVSLGLWTAANWVTAVYRGTTEKMTQGVWESFGLSGLRGLGMILAFAALGFGLAAIGRHVVLPLGLVLGTGVLSIISIPIMMSAQVPYAEKYFIPTHINAWLYKQVEVQDYTWQPGPLDDCSRGCEAPVSIISFGESGTFALALIVVIMGLAYWTMKRRDVA